MFLFRSISISISIGDMGQRASASVSLASCQPQYLTRSIWKANRSAVSNLPRPAVVVVSGPAAVSGPVVSAHVSMHHSPHEQASMAAGPPVARRRARARALAVSHRTSPSGLCAVAPRQLRRGCCRDTHERGTRRGQIFLALLWKERGGAQAGTEEVGRAVSSGRAVLLGCLYPTEGAILSYPKGRKLCGLRSFSFTGTAHAFHIGIPLEPSPTTMDRSGSFGHPVQQVQPTSISNTTGARHAHRRFYGHPHVTRRPIGTRVLLLWTVYRGERGVVYSRLFSKEAMNTSKGCAAEHARTHARRPGETREEEATRGGGYTS